MPTENDHAMTDIHLDDIADANNGDVQAPERSRPRLSIANSRAIGFQRVITAHMLEVAKMKGVNLFEAQFECQIIFEGGTTAIGMLRTTDDPMLYCITCILVQDGKQVQGVVAEHYFHVKDIIRLVVPKQVAPQQRIWSPNQSQ